MTNETEQDRTEQVIKVTVKLIDGDSDEFHFNVDHLIGSDKEKVLNKFHIKPAPNVIYHFA